MLEYVQFYPETIALVKRYPAADRALLYEAMVMYGTTGEEPDWPEDDLKWFVWESLRQRVAMAESAKAAKSRAGKGGADKRWQNQPENGTGKQTMAEDSTAWQTVAEHGSESDAESEPDPDPEPEPRGEITHKDPQQGDSAGAHAGERETVPAGWYDPEQPDRPCDASWLGSPQARKSIAQRILDHVIRRRIITPGAVTAESGRTMGREIMDALQAAMAAGKSPGECQKLAHDARDLWVWEIRLKEIALAYGTAPPAMADLWKQDVAELSAEAEEVALYG